MADKEVLASGVPEPSASAEPSAVTTTTAETAKDEVAKPSEHVLVSSKEASKEESKPVVDESGQPAESASKETPAAAVPPPSPFAQFATKLPELVKEIGHDEMWGVTLATTQPIESHVPTQIIIQKFLNANDGDLTKALEQFTGAMKFRKENKPLELLTKTFKTSKFGDLGVVTFYPVKDSVVPEVFTWNLYGNVKDRMDEVFVPLKEYLATPFVN